MVTSVRGSGKWMTCLSYLDRRAFTKGTVWEIGRTQVGENAVAVWKTGCRAKLAPSEHQGRRG